MLNGRKEPERLVVACQQDLELGIVTNGLRFVRVVGSNFLIHFLRLPLNAPREVLASRLESGLLYHVLKGGKVSLSNDFVVHQACSTKASSLYC